jgi:hypothetical protein
LVKGRKADMGQLGYDVAMMVPSFFGQAFFQAYLFYPVQSMGFVFRINHHNQMIVLGINAFLVISLANFCPLIIGKGSAETVDF